MSNPVGLATADSRFLSKDFATDSAACLVNEAAVRKFNIEDLLNQSILASGEDEMRIVGVMKDHHFLTLKHEIGAQVVFLKRPDWNWSGYLNGYFEKYDTEMTVRRVKAKMKPGLRRLAMMEYMDRKTERAKKQA